MAALLALMAATVGRADILQPTVILPPPGGVYTFGPVCLSNPSIMLDRCLENTLISGLTTITDNEIGGNEVVTASANYSANVYTDNSGTPGTFLGNLLMTGTIDVTYIGRDPAINPLGTFTTDVTDFDFTGMLNGNTIEFVQNPGIPSTGSTTILVNSVTPIVEYSVSSSVDLNGEYNFNNTGLMTAPVRTATLTGVPEPGTETAVGSVLLLLGIASRRFRTRPRV